MQASITFILYLFCRQPIHPPLSSFSTWGCRTTGNIFQSCCCLLPQWAETTFTHQNDQTQPLFATLRAAAQSCPPRQTGVCWAAAPVPAEFSCNYNSCNSSCLSFSSRLYFGVSCLKRVSRLQRATYNSAGTFSSIQMLLSQTGWLLAGNPEKIGRNNWN